MSAAARYKNVQVSTCSPGQLVVMMCDGVLRFLDEAHQAMERTDRARAGERLGRSQALLSELAAGLDPSHAPEVCDSLAALYGYCIRRLLHANLKQDREAVKEVIELIRPVRDAWATVIATSPTDGKSTSGA
jgi:flagellar protein FliS